MNLAALRHTREKCYKKCATVMDAFTSHSHSFAPTLCVSIPTAWPVSSPEAICWHSRQSHAIQSLFPKKNSSYSIHQKAKCLLHFEANHLGLFHFCQWHFLVPGNAKWLFAVFLLSFLLAESTTTVFQRRQQKGAAQVALANLRNQQNFQHFGLTEFNSPSNICLRSCLAAKQSSDRGTSSSRASPMA